MVPFLNLKSSYEELRGEIDKRIFEVLQSGSYVGGDVVEKFETNWAKYCGVPHCVGVGNGFDALVLALKALDIGHGDEVLVPAHTFFATWSAVSTVGAVPVPIDVFQDTFNIDAERLELSITNKTKAIIAVHLYGQSADLEKIQNVCANNNLFLIEDAAQAHGVAYKNKKIGGHGDIVCWSFYPGKNLGAFGDGGAVTTNNQDLATKIRCLSNYGSKVKYHHDLLGINSRLDPIQAAVLDVKLKYLDIWNERRQTIASKYIKNFVDLPVVTPITAEFSSHVWHLFVLQLENRDSVAMELHDRGISTLIHYPRLPQMQESYRNSFYKKKGVENSFKLVERILSIPIGPHLSDEDVEKVISSVRNIYSF